MKVQTGLDQLWSDRENIKKKHLGNIGYLCHSASVSQDLHHGLELMVEVFGEKLVKIFSPQHGLVSDVQDNMIETDHYIHPYFKRPVYSLYSETRKPTDQMLEGLNTVFIDLQDVGTRIYTYIYTMTLFMEACQNKDIKVVILDRPNPINGVDIEGNILDLTFKSFVGRHPLPVRHGMTIGEIALMAKNQWGIDCQLEVITMKNWQREMSFEKTSLPWVLPSPNLPNIEAAYTFVGTVLLEGCSISEGRGTTKSLEIFGHPQIEPFIHQKPLNDLLANYGLTGFYLRPISFLPMFQKHAHKACGGYQIHVTDRKLFKPWKTLLVIMQYFYSYLGSDFKWKEPPYEYVYDQNPFDIINGTDLIRHWIEKKEDFEVLEKIEGQGQLNFIEQRQKNLLY